MEVAHFVLQQEAVTLQVIELNQLKFNSKIKERMHEKWSEGQYIAYFQAFTNTHAPVEVLKENMNLS